MCVSIGKAQVERKRSCRV